MPDLASLPYWRSSLSLASRTTAVSEKSHIAVLNWRPGSRCTVRPLQNLIRAAFQDRWDWARTDR